MPKRLVPSQPLSTTASDLIQLMHGSGPLPGVSPCCNPAISVHVLFPTHCSATVAAVFFASHRLLEASV